MSWARTVALAFLASFGTWGRSWAAAPPPPKKAPPTREDLAAEKAKVAQTVQRLKQQALAAQEQELTRLNRAAESTLTSLRAKLPPPAQSRLGPTVKLGQLPPNWRVLAARGTRDIPNLPRIERLDPTAGVVGKELTLHGSHFGAAQGGVNLHIADLTVVCPVTKWEDAKIVITIPDGLEGVVGELPKDARLWVNPPTPGIATTALQVGPNPAHYYPTISRVYGPAIVPGQLYVFEGFNFLQAKEGAVEFRLPSQGATYTCSIHQWLDRLLSVKLPGNIQGVPAEKGVLTVRNHLGMETTRPVTFQPLMDVEVLAASKRLDFNRGKGREQIVLHDLRLQNTWSVVDAESDPVPPTAWDLRWETRPARGGSDCRCVLSGSAPGIEYVTITCYVRITGPKGMDYRR